MPLKKRLAVHVTDSRRHKHRIISRAIKKYGIAAFDASEFFRVDDPKKLDLAEQITIRLFRSNNPTFGYNMTEGGGGARGFHLRPETKEKLRKKRLGKKASAKTRRRISEVQLGDKNHNFGKKLSDEHKQKIREAIKQHWQRRPAWSYTRGLNPVPDGAPIWKGLEGEQAAMRARWAKKRGAGGGT